MSIDYEKVKGYMKASMLDKYKTGEAVTIKYINGSCPEDKINWLSYRNDGEKLPVKYKFYWRSDKNKSRPRSIKMPKGYVWLIKYLSEACRKNDADILPAMFIYLFSRDAFGRTEYDVKTDLGISSKDVFCLLECSEKELLQSGYSVPDSKCKSFLDLNLAELLCLMSERKRDEKLIADIIMSMINNMTKRYILVEERYSDEEYKRVEKLEEQRYGYISKKLSDMYEVYKQQPNKSI